jgi:deoxyribose-phosphate aldolase
LRVVTGLSEGVGRLVRFMEGIAGRIDQTMLKYDKGFRDYERWVEESDGYGFRALVVPSSMVGYVSSIAKTPVAGVAGFPYGYFPLEVKVREVDTIASSGGREVDVVIDIINVKSGRFDAVRGEVESLVKEAKEVGLAIKVIVETSALDDDELIKVSQIVASSGADFIKTNSGYGSRGVTLRDIYLIKAAVGDSIKVKAAGGVRTALDAAALIEAGADVIGASSGIKIVNEARKYLGGSITGLPRSGS